MNRVILFFAAIVFTSATAQNLSYDFYAFRLGNMFNVNPAYCAKDEGINVMLNAQSQNAGVNYANKNIMAGAYSLISQHQGMGLKVISDTRGAFQLLKADVSYAYVAKLSDAHTLRMGIAAGINTANVSTTRIANYQSLDQTDPTLTTNNFNTKQFTAGAGLLYTFKDLDVSFSLPHIVTTTQPINSYMNAAVFYKIKVNEMIKIQPWISYQNIPVTKNVEALLVKGIYKDMFWLQAGYQSNNNFMAAFGATFENLGFSYGFKMSNNKFTSVTGGIHELAITMKINPGKGKSKGSGSNASLDQIIANLDRLLTQEVTPDNKASIRAELEKVKAQLQNAELDNSDPEKAKKVEQQLQQIDEKLKQIEKKLGNE